MEPLWKECISWLNKFKVIPQGHPALASGASPHDLIQLLRDGVVLCQLVHCLDPQSVDMTQVIKQSRMSVSHWYSHCHCSLLTGKWPIITRF